MKNMNWRITIRIFICAAVAGLAEQPADAQLASPHAITLASHRAVYDLSLDETGAGSNVTDIRGQLIYDFSGTACQGYTLNTRLVTEVFDREGKASMTDIRSESWEDAEGKRFQFNTSQYADNKLSESTKGVARHTGHNQDHVIVDLEKPKRAVLDLSGQILFPTQHSIALLKAALAGQQRLQANIYDGSEKGAKVYETTSIIGPPLQLSANSELPQVKNSEVLATIPSWPVVVSYYDQGPKKDALPSYEVSFRMYENGVSRKLKLDYGTFSLKGELSAIEFLPQKPCP